MGGFGGKRKRETPEEQDLRQMWKDVIQLGEQHGSRATSANGAIADYLTVSLVIHMSCLSGTSTLQGYDRRSYEARKTVEMGGLVSASSTVS